MARERLAVKDGCRRIAPRTSQDVPTAQLEIREGSLHRESRRRDAPRAGRGKQITEVIIWIKPGSVSTLARGFTGLTC